MEKEANMQVNRINNQQPSFGMKYVKPREWDPKVLKTLMDSSLVKEIDAKYPKAKAVWEECFNPYSDLSTYCELNIVLAKDKVIEFFYRDKLDDNYYSSSLDCAKKIKNSTLNDLEQMYDEDQRFKQDEAMEKTENERIFARAEAENAKIRSPFQNFICKIFGIK